MFRKLFMFVFFTLAIGALGLTVWVMVTSEPTERAVPLTVEEQNHALSLVYFSMEGSPSGEWALWVGPQTIASYLQPGKDVTLPLTGEERQAITLRVRSAGEEWDTIHSFGSIEHGSHYRIEASGLSAKVWCSVE